MNSINSNTLSMANDEAIFNVYSYIAYKNSENENENKSFNYIVKELEKKFNKEHREDIELNRTGDDIKWKEDEINQLKVLKSAIKNNPDLGKAKIKAQEIDEDGMTATAFEKSNGDVSIVYRGTGKGEWIDNGKGLRGTYDKQYGYDTPQQHSALKWFNKVCDENNWDKNTNITVSGHSKGGNKAQFVAMNADRVDRCYSFDGQGFSPEAIKSFKEKYGEDVFEKRRKKMYSFAAENDYVNVLGERLVPKDQIYYFKAPMADKAAVKYHYAEAMLDENGVFNSQCEQGEISEYIENTSKELMRFEPELREGPVMGLMNVCQKLLGKGIPVNGDNVDLLTTIEGVTISLDPLIKNLIFTKDGHEAIFALTDDIGSLYDKIGKHFGPVVEFHAILISSVVASFFARDMILNLMIISKKVYYLKELRNKLAKLSSELYNKVKDFFASVITGLQSLYNKYFNSGYKYAAGHTYIEVDTGLLRYYANRLYNINNRLLDLDRRLDSLYTKVGLFDLWSLIQADLMMGYSWRINRCISYLNDTADEFENVERSILSQL